MSGTTGAARAVAGPAIAPGFALVGIAVDVVPAGGDLGAALTRAAGREGTSVVLVEDRLYDTLPPELRRRWDRSVVPVIVPFPSPGPEDERAQGDRIVDLIRRAIGYRVRLQ
jgi:vacuolar-type H+-ATPase subunit F/Vma7